ncbi:SGNH/GDSL hydrolase family protein [Rathayibacter tanaceti]|uniref:GDSL-like Lipase/Acylhydrolase n=2 Tax=Rathayibacter tanaceti TaxID=1671680 RepID=A0A162G1P8_9MICO|nr:SGNH/GDSL hydrolase family protein [Rathayibacter tanaceti]KZX22830.1 GDSL-like Lipase/Acylhydrolase [Rathayibacter tanaceti]QHC55510.1 SGNH/GDSL hydrolase family protein [Rathayibacter tanaceti]TCO39714.1 lysophospholipase L1-like esterase [Rathayibacter tanaceti]
MTAVRYVAIGDSFTEGVGDERPDGVPRGWADLVAQGWARAGGERIEYANLAIRGRLIAPILAEQLEPALALGPTHLSFNGGGNDMLRPRADIERIADAYLRVLERCDEQGVTLIALAGADPSPRLPLGAVVRRRGDALTDAVLRRLGHRSDVVVADNWHDPAFADPALWSEDRLHLGPRGHVRVAERVLRALGMTPSALEGTAPERGARSRVASTHYYRRHVAPWVHRRLTGTSSGDGRAAKYAAFVPIEPV